MGEPSVYCYTGQTLQARLTCQDSGLFKNVLYHVQTVSELECVLKMSDEYADDPANISIPTTELGKSFRMAYAVVYLNVQGRAISGNVVLWDTLQGNVPHPHITLRHFIVGLQRVRDPAQLKVATLQQQKAFLGADVEGEPEPKRRRR